MMTEVTPDTRATMMSLLIAALSLGRAFGDIIAPYLFEWGFMANAGACLILDLLAVLALSRVRLPKDSECTAATM
jgi:predicted MFS family arabinose efflux permease